MCWPMAIVSDALPSRDGVVHRVRRAVIRNGDRKQLYRLSNDLVFLLTGSD